MRTTVRNATPQDIPRLIAIENATQMAPWTEEIFKRSLAVGYDCWVIEEEERVIGFIMMSSVVGESHILNVCIDPAYQRQGYGQKLVNYAIAQADRKKMSMIYLEVRRSNKPAIALYDKLGFVQISERKNYYPLDDKREDALIFALELGLMRQSPTNI